MFIFISLLSHVALLISLYTCVLPKSAALDSNAHQILSHYVLLVALIVQKGN